MNERKKNIQDNFEILRKIQKKPESSQRALAKELGFSLGKLNYCLKELKKKGLVKLKNFLNNNAPDYRKALIPYQNVHCVTYNLRNNDNIKLPYSKLETYRRLFFTIWYKTLEFA